MLRAEDLTKEGMVELVEPCPRDTDEGEFYWEKGDCDLHILDKGGMSGGDGGRRVYADGLH